MISIPLVYFHLYGDGWDNTFELQVNREYGVRSTGDTVHTSRCGGPTQSTFSQTTECLEE